MRFAQLDDESRLQAMTKLSACDKYPGENISELFARFNVERGRAAREGGFQVTSEGSALQLIKAVGRFNLPDKIIRIIKSFYENPIFLLKTVWEVLSIKNKGLE